MNLTDVFILSHLEVNDVHSFIKNELANFNSMDTYYEFPKYSQQTTFETESFDEMLSFVLESPGRSYTFYFESDLNTAYPQVIVQINIDGSICLCLSTTQENKDLCKNLLASRFPNKPIYTSQNVPLTNSISDLNK